MKPCKRLPRTVCLVGHTYRVRVSPCPRLFARDGDGDAREVVYYLDMYDREVLLPRGVDPADWPAFVSELEETALANTTPALPDVPMRLTAGGWIVSHKGRDYTVAPTEESNGYPRDAGGATCLCCIDHGAARIEYARTVRPVELLKLLREALTIDAQEPPMRRAA